MKSHKIIANAILEVHSNLDRVNKSVMHTLFVHYFELFTTISNVICLANPQIRSWVLFTILRNSLYRDLLHQGLSVLYRLS